jgi:7-cyano-7-deazaguanine synthase
MRTALLLSGGMDSSAIAHWRRPELAFTLDYGQKAALGEIRAASAAAEALEIEHHIIVVDLAALGSGDLAGTPPLSIAPVADWWPFRNQMLVTLAAMKGMNLGVRRLIIGTLRTDSHHADGGSRFMRTLSDLLRVQEGAIDLEAPAIQMTASELIRTSGVPPEILGWAHSCHVAEFACGVCGGCRKHYETLKELGIEPY